MLIEERTNTCFWGERGHPVLIVHIAKRIIKLRKIEAWFNKTHKQNQSDALRKAYLASLTFTRSKVRFKINK